MRKSLFRNKKLSKAYNLVMRRPKICKQARRECKKMCEVASKVKGVIVEIGRYRGGSLLLLTLSSPSSKIYSVDVSSKYNNVALKLCDKFRVPANRYEMITNDSIQVAKKWESEIDLLFIDGDHTFEGVYSDLLHWVPHVKVSGTILVHDYFPPSKAKRKEVGPYEALSRYRSKYDMTRIVGVVQKMCILRRQ